MVIIANFLAWMRKKLRDREQLIDQKIPNNKMATLEQILDKDWFPD